MVDFDHFGKCSLIEHYPASMPSDERKATFAARRAKMLEDKIDCAKFLTYFIESYPQSADQTRNANEAFWSRFK